MNIQEYLKYYLGTEVKCYIGHKPEPIFVPMAMAYQYRDSYGYTKPLLRPLSDMSEEEAREFAIAYGLSNDIKPLRVGVEGSLLQFEYSEKGDAKFIHWYVQKLSAEMFHYLLSRGFDLFGLIEKGLALDAKTVKNKNQ